MGLISVVDPIALNLDPDPEFWHNLDSYPLSRVMLAILKKKIPIINNFRDKLFFLTIFFKL